MSGKSDFETRLNKRELREADFIGINNVRQRAIARIKHVKQRCDMKAPTPHSPRSNLPFVQDWPKSDFPDRNYARLKVARSEDRALLGSNPSARVGERNRSRFWPTSHKKESDL